MFRTASPSARLHVPFGTPKDIVITAGRTACAATHSIPATVLLIDPDPLQSKTRTATRLASLATPTHRPMAVEATWVPWPSQSMAEDALRVTKSYPYDARDFPVDQSRNS